MGAGGMASPDAGTARFAQLDGVRGLAALMVALSHFVLAFQPALLGGETDLAHFAASALISHTPLIFLFNPELGVAIFFTLSGFVLAASVTAKPTRFVELAVRRWLRLALPILGSTLLIWPLAHWQLFRSVEAAPLAKSSWLGMNYFWLTFEPNDLLLLVWQSLVDVFARARAYYNLALWTMPIEFWGSMGLYATYCLIPRVMARPGAGIAVALLALAAVWRTNYFGFPCGVTLFETLRLWRRLPPARREKLAPLAGPLGCGLLIAGVLMGGNPYNIDLAAHGPYGRLFLTLSPWIENPVLLVHRLGAVALVAAALPWLPMRRVLTTRPIQWLGRVSFMVYLCHVPIICSLVAAGFLWLAPTLGYNWATAVLLPVFLATLFVVAEVATRLFDAPAIFLARRIGRAVGAVARRLGARTRPASA